MHKISQNIKNLINIFSGFSRSLNKLALIFFCEHFSLLIFHLSLIFHIFFISNDNYLNIFWSQSSDLANPLVNILKRLSTFNRIANDNAVWAFKETGRKSVKSLLASSIPNLVLQLHIINLVDFHLKIYCNCR